MRAELRIDGVMIALAEEMQVEFGDLRAEVVRIVLRRLVTVAISDVQPIRHDRPSIVDLAFEDAAWMQFL
jgi:hypothetical protein